MTAPRRPRFLVPEVVQTSAMDCGPAVLAALSQGFGTRASYGRLREACQTDVDGTSIDTLEAVAGQLGLAAEQVMIPVDHLLLAEADALPSVLVVRQPGGLTHFVLAWRRHGPLVQVMDPAVGRRWLTGSRLLEDAHVHEHRIPAAVWREWAGSEDFCRPLGRRLRDLGLGRGAEALVGAAAADPGWRPLARVAPAGRLGARLGRSGRLRRGREAGALLRAFLEPAEGADETRTLPDACWSVRPAPAGGEGEEHLLMRGAVFVRVRGRQAGAGREEQPAVL